MTPEEREEYRRQRWGWLWAKSLEPLVGRRTNWCAPCEKGWYAKPSNKSSNISDCIRFSWELAKVVGFTTNYRSWEKKVKKNQKKFSPKPAKILHPFTPYYTLFHFTALYYTKFPIINNLCKIFFVIKSRLALYIM